MWLKWLKNKAFSQKTIAVFSRPDLAYRVILYPILIFAFFIRIYNINYNSPFKDEATSVFIGRLGLFQGDWVSYNPTAWMSGHPYINPLFSAAAYMTDGIAGSRFLSVVLSVLTIEIVAFITGLFYEGKKNYRYIAGIIAAVILTFSPISLYVSRLTTYDMKCFYLLFMSLLLLKWIERTDKNWGKLYFISAALLMLALLAKVITLIYIPIFFVYSFFQVRKDKERFYYWKYYYCLPLIAMGIMYFFLHVGDLLSFGQRQADSKKAFALSELLGKISDSIYLESGWFAIGSIGILSRTQWKKWLQIAGFGFIVLASHLVTHRAIGTMEKHIFLTVSAMAAVSGIGIAYLLEDANTYFSRRVAAALFVLWLIYYAWLGFGRLSYYNDQWPNATGVSRYISQHVSYGDKILTETGSPIILAVYDKNPPINTTTFDSFVYRKKEGAEAYRNAVADGYFKYIELLDQTDDEGDVDFGSIQGIVKSGMKKNYELIYKDNYSLLYKRKY